MEGLRSHSTHIIGGIVQKIDMVVRLRKRPMPHCALAITGGTPASQSSIRVNKKINFTLLKNFIKGSDILNYPKQVKARIKI